MQTRLGNFEESRERHPHQLVDLTEHVGGIVGVGLFENPLELSHQIFEVFGAHSPTARRNLWISALFSVFSATPNLPT